MSIAYQSDQGVATITIDRPEKKNAITGDMYDALVASLKRAADDKSVRAVLITGAGAAFTAGNDLKDFSESTFIQPDSPVLGFMHALAAFEKPVVAAVNGLAVGIGVTMLLHCDLVYVADNATFSMPFTSLGLVPEFASTLLLPLIAGRVRAAEKLLLGRPFPAAGSGRHGSRQCRAAGGGTPAACAEGRAGLQQPAARRRPRLEKTPAPGPGRRHPGGDPARGFAFRASARGRRSSRSDRRNPREAAAGFLEVRVGRWPCSTARPRPCPAAWYYDPAQYARELEAVWYRDWVCVGRLDDLRESGDFIVETVGGESLILTRDREGRPRAYHNACRHRGSRLCNTPRGRFANGRIVCPYHAWTYALSGELVATPKMDLPAGFHRDEYALYEAHVDTWGGFLFVNLDERPACTLTEFLGEEARTSNAGRWPGSCRCTAR